MAVHKAVARTARHPAVRTASSVGKNVTAAPEPISRRRRILSVAPVIIGTRQQPLAIPSNDVVAFARALVHATPLQLVETERQGVPAQFVKQLSQQLKMPANRMFVILALPKATAAKKAAKGGTLTGQSAHAALAVTKLLGMAEGMLQRSTAPEAEHFDVGRWLGEWLERSQPALGGRKAADLLDTPTGFQIVSRVLGAVESGSYQ